MKLLLCFFSVVFLSQINCGIYTMHKNRNFFHDLTIKDKVQRGNIVGERRIINVNDQHVSELLRGHLGRLITAGDDDSKFVVQRIDEVTKQTVAGISYKVRGYYTVEGTGKDCTVTILERMWHEKEEKVIISASCSDGSCYVAKNFICSPKSLLTFF